MSNNPVFIVAIRNNVSRSVERLALVRSFKTRQLSVVATVAPGEEAVDVSRAIASYNAVCRLSLSVVRQDGRLRVALPSRDANEGVAYLDALASYLNDRDTTTTASPLLAGVALAATPVGATVKDNGVMVTIDGVSYAFSADPTDDVPVTRLVDASSFEVGGDVLTVNAGDDAFGGTWAVVFRPHDVSGPRSTSTKYYVFFYQMEGSGLRASRPLFLAYGEEAYPSPAPAVG